MIRGVRDRLRHADVVEAPERTAACDRRYVRPRDDDRDRPVAIIARRQVRALRPHIADIKIHFRRQLLLKGEVPLLGVRIAYMRVESPGTEQPRPGAALALERCGHLDGLVRAPGER